MTSPKTIRDLLVALQTTGVRELLTTYKAEAPFLFQSIGIILTVARLLPRLSGKITLNKGNSNTGFAELTNFYEFLESNVRNGNADGKSDCTFKMGDDYYITSAKLREGDKVSVAKDMGDLVALRSSVARFKDAHFMMFVRDRNEWLAAYKRARTNEMYPISPELVFDIDTFETAVKELRKILALYPSIDTFAVKYLACDKTRLVPRFHQHLASILYKRGDVFLVAMKCRSGKTIVELLLILDHGFNTILHITPVPSETRHPTIETFSKYIEFDGYTIVNLEKKETIPVPRPEKLIVVASKQYLDKHYARPDIAALHFDAIVQDEIHWAGLTDKTNAMRKALVREDTSLIVMSATGERARNELGIDSEHIVYWNLEDEAACKAGDIPQLEATFGKEAVQEALARSYPSSKSYADDLRKTYAEMPRLRQLIYKMKSDFLANFRECVEADKYSFDMKELFRMEKGSLVYRDKVLKFFKSYLGATDGSCMHSTMDTIRELGTRAGNVGPQYYPGGGGATQLWFLPEAPAGGSLDELSALLETLIIEHFPEYLPKRVNSSVNLDRKRGVEKMIAEFEHEAIVKGKSGVIVLLGRMLAMGVSLPRADIVCMFNNLTAMDLYIQASMRCLTQDVNKREGIVVDFNQKRVLEASMKMVPRCTGTGGEIIDRMTKVIAFGSNSFETKDVTEVVTHFNKIWLSKSFDKVKVLGARLNNFVGALAVTAEEQREIMKSNWIRSTSTSLREKRALLEEGERIPDAVRETADTTSVSDEETEEEPELLEDVVPNFSYEVLTTIPPFVAFLTYKHKREEFIGTLLEMIQSDAILNSIFREQCASWWKGTASIDFTRLLINIFNRCDSNASRGISSIMSALKSEMESLIDDMHATLNFLNSILEPKESEKKEYGEVFTPDWFAETMLSTYPQDVWSNPTSIFYDPSAGSGVFGVCVYYRLFDGLASVIPDPVARKVHILTKMLYMSELGSKNVAILRHIFGPLANIYHGDSLTFNAASHWKFWMSDVHVIGNPPYNKERSRSGACPLYNEFIEKYINECRTLLFVVPSRWFSGGKGLDNFRKMMLARKDIRFITHIDDASSVFGSNVSIKGGVNYFMVDRTYHGKCLYNGTPVDLSTLDVLVDSKYLSIISKVTAHPSITSIYRPGATYKIRTNGKLNGVPVLCDDASLTKCYVSKQNGFLKYVDPAVVSNPSPSWKVLTTAAAHMAGSGFGNIFVATPDSIHTDSYVSFNTASEQEAHSLASFLKTKLANRILGLRKPSQHVNGDTCKWIPLPPLDRIWSDDDVNAYYNLTVDEIALL